MAGTRVTRLQDQTFTPGTTVNVQVAGALPPRRVVYGVMFRLDIDITQPAAGQVIQLGSVLHQLLANVKIGRRVAVSGLALRFLNWAMLGREPQFPAGLPATANGVFSRSVEWSLWYAD